MKLYEITNEFKFLFEQLDEDGELTPVMEETMSALSDDFEEKAIAVASYIKNLEAEEIAITNAINDMKIRKYKLTKKVQSLSDYLQYNMTLLSINEIKTSPYFKIKLKQCPPSIDVLDECLIPDVFWREKLVKSVDKIKLKEVLSEGIEVPGASIRRKVKLEIK